MVTTLFDDEIISSTDLKNNQKRWFDKALKSPVSITNRGRRLFVLINREQARNLVLARDYAEKIFKFCQDLKEEAETGCFTSDVFPWGKHLSKEDRLAYRDELIAAFAEMIHTNNWSGLDEIISSWEATAEALTNSKFMEVVNSRPVQRKYTRVE